MIGHRVFILWQHDWIPRQGFWLQIFWLMRFWVDMLPFLLQSCHSSGWIVMFTRDKDRSTKTTGNSPHFFLWEDFFWRGKQLWVSTKTFLGKPPRNMRGKNSTKPRQQDFNFESPFEDFAVNPDIKLPPKFNSFSPLKNGGGWLKGPIQIRLPKLV